MFGALTNEVLSSKVDISKSPHHTSAYETLRLLRPGVHLKRLWLMGHRHPLMKMGLWKVMMMMVKNMMTLAATMRRFKNGI